MIRATELEPALDGLWAVHPGSLTFWGTPAFSRRARHHIAFERPGFRLHETGRGGRLERAGTSAGLWRVVDLDGQALLVLTVRSHRPSRWADAMLGSNHGYSGGSLAVTGARAVRDTEELAMRDGAARMYFLPVRLGPGLLEVALPSACGHTPRQRWTRVRQGRS